MNRIELNVYEINNTWRDCNSFEATCRNENIAKKFKISREEQDEFSASSQQKTEAAQSKNIFNDEIIPISIAIPPEDAILFLCIPLSVGTDIDMGYLINK